MSQLVNYLPIPIRVMLMESSLSIYTMCMCTFREDDPILQDSSQEPSVSSKYDFEDGGLLRHF